MLLVRSCGVMLVVYPLSLRRQAEELCSVECLPPICLVRGFGEWHRRFWSSTTASARAPFAFRSPFQKVFQKGRPPLLRARLPNYSEAWRRILSETLQAYELVAILSTPSSEAELVVVVVAVVVVVVVEPAELVSVLSWQGTEATCFWLKLVNGQSCRSVLLDAQ
jgi:hypothetical protein